MDSIAADDEDEADPLPYGSQWVTDDDVEAVVETLRSDWLTTGPKVPAFEEAVTTFCGAGHGVAVSSGTAGLHAAMFAAGVGPGDEVVAPPMTFCATTNAVLFEGGTPVFADVAEPRLLVDPDRVREAITDRTRAIVGVDHTGHPCDYRALREIADDHGLVLIADACHSLGATYRGGPVGTQADLTVFSFHPVKPITTAEGGMVVTDDAEMADAMRRFRNHGLDRTHRDRAEAGTFTYAMQDLGYNYRLSDVHCALGISQLERLPAWVKRRRALAARYDEALAGVDGVEPLGADDDVEHGYHLYVVRITGDRADRRAEVFDDLRDLGIGVNVHYIPVHLHPYYRDRLGTGPGLCPVAEAAYETILTLPLFPRMADGDVDRVVDALGEVLA